MYEQIQQRLKQPKYYVTVLILLFLIALAMILYMNHSTNEVSSPSPVTEMNQSELMSQQASTPKQDTPPITDIIVDVKGAVMHPRTYTMKSNQRVDDLLKKAGVLHNADVSQINLAEKLMDQKMIYVPFKGEKSTMQQAQNMTSATTESDIKPINLNLAQSSDLTEIPGIGPSKAELIINYREEKGGFKTVEELKEVKGIGEKTFEKLKPYFVV
ncbi:MULTISPECIES: helix-hairpin-helix domain-containing protein [Staphylococcus]|uniref:Competence protein ComEA n=2 Tax=Staphylococcus agnetis TaxID=985762 RepID=A0A2T4MJ73_9STAP|nr:MULTISPECIES: helix-hairpin-helix domain-containing protein [Staphylococcus]ALN76556.1 competence protein ComEA [Staphylococcus agnetis]MDG4942613.1 helix-hairpin-helix domain-containing protein [Staphylococcus agnetis]NHM93188.1 competence protein ComEA [Staphylococcus sp. 10602379]NJI03393.1 competence protein ComEA [Staphylococcus agnetis]NJI14140.1 competence protein ComEA [Staphylococcus agnetis]